MKPKELTPYEYGVFNVSKKQYCIIKTLGVETIYCFKVTFDETKSDILIWGVNAESEIIYCAINRDQLLAVIVN